MITQQNNVTQVHQLRARARSRSRRKFPIKLILSGLAALLFGLITVTAIVLGYAFRGNPEINDRPLVLIHSPLNWEQLAEGDGVTVHATARSPGGIKRVELWVDDQLIAQREADQSEPPKSMVLSADWVPTIAGNHRLIVRATSASDVDGQASILVESIENNEVEPTGTYTVQEGETLDSIAQGNGTTVDDLTVLNPGLAPGAAPVPGTELIVPNDEPPSEGAQPIPTDSEPPPPVGEPPAPFSFFFPGFRVFSQEPPAEPTQLRMELLALRTPIAYESLTCYIGMADQTPRRYPDADWDPSTDESFARVKSADKNSTSWNVASYLAGKRIPAFSWPEDQSLPLDIACVGIAGGGTQSFRLGRLELAIPPEDWDGTIRRARVVGAEGAFAVIYRVGHTETEPTGVPKRLDTSMPAPTNLRVANYSAVFAPEPDPSVLGDEPTSVVEDFRVDPFAPPVLLWSYTPGEDEAGNEIPIDGFRIYLNGTLLWMERADRMVGGNHYTVLPPEWLNPPCGEVYVVTVSAWRAGGDDDGHESFQSWPVSFETPVDDCSMRGYIAFETLETFVLDDDGDFEDREGKIGPPYGDFYVNDERAHFDAGSLEREPGWGVLEYGYSGYNGMNDNSSYSLSHPALRFERNPVFRVLLDEDEPIELSYSIMDEDTGKCEEPDDPGCDDVICEGSMEINFFENPNPERHIYSTNGACMVTYNWEIQQAPLPGLAGYEGNHLPMPSLEIEDIVVDGTSGVTSFTIENYGVTSWAHHPLTIGVTNAAGISQEPLVIDDLNLAPGDTYEATYSPPDDFFYPCFTLDPDNMVQESMDSFSYSRTVCAEPPDLAIRSGSVRFDSEANSIKVFVSNLNNDHTPIINGNMIVSMYLPDGTPLGISDSETGIYSQDRDYIHDFELPLGTIQHSDLSGGYRVQVESWPSPEDLDYSNNTYDIPRTERIFLGLCNATHINRNTISLTPYLLSGGSRWPQETLNIFPDEYSQDAPYRYEGCKYPSRMIDLAGDMQLRVEVVSGEDEQALGQGFGYWVNSYTREIASETPEEMATCGDIGTLAWYIESSSGDWHAEVVVCKLATP